MKLYTYVIIIKYDYQLKNMYKSFYYNLQNDELRVTFQVLRVYSLHVTINSENNFICKDAILTIIRGFTLTKQMKVSMLIYSHLTS